jgi:probable rRNA maturation factor
VTSVVYFFIFLRNSIIKISVYNKQKSLKISSPSVKEVVATTLSFYNASCDEIAIHFISTSSICKLHQEFFNDPAPTDCISFPYDPAGSPGCFLGEVFVCPETARDYVEKKGKDVYEEVMLYIVHGILHLLGWDDLEESDRKKMKKEERRVMKYLKDRRLMISP